MPAFASELCNTLLRRSIVSFPPRESTSPQPPTLASMYVRVISDLGDTRPAHRAEGRRTGDYAATISCIQWVLTKAEAKDLGDRALPRKYKDRVYGMCRCRHVDVQVHLTKTAARGATSVRTTPL